MDLRSIPVPQHEIGVMKTLIARQLVSYQPFIFADDLEVGEGWAFATGTSASWPPRKEVVHWPDCPQTIAPLAVPEDKVEAFRTANAALRNWYEDNVRLIAGLVGRPSGHDFLELGCHNGYVLHRLSEMGARRAIGVDGADHADVFKWFNRVTGSSAEFVHATWDSTNHRLSGDILPEVDVAISVSMSCHVADPLHMLAYLCHLACRSVFFMIPLSGRDDCSITFGHPPNYYRGDLRWPSSFDSAVLPSGSLVELALEQCGFSTIERPKDNVFVARRTGAGRSIYAPETSPRRLDPQLIEEGVQGQFNIIHFDGMYYALAQDEGEFSIEKVRLGAYRRCVVGASLAEIKQRAAADLGSPRIVGRLMPQGLPIPPWRPPCLANSGRH